MNVFLEYFGHESVANYWDFLIADEPSTTILHAFGLFPTLEQASLFIGCELDAVTISTAFLALGCWWPGEPDAATAWNTAATLFAALIASGAAILGARLAARSTMKSALALQDRERQLEAQSVAALLSADLHGKLIMLAHLLQESKVEQVRQLAAMDTNTRPILDASLPKLGGLGHQGAAQLLTAYEGLSLLTRDAQRGGQAIQELTARMRDVATHIGLVLNTLWELYELDRPKRLEAAMIDLKAVGLEQLKDLGL